MGILDFKMYLISSFGIWIAVAISAVHGACQWYGTAPFCSTSTSTCTDKWQVVGDTSSRGDGSRCWSGHKTKCCDPAAGFDGILHYGSGIAASSCWYRCQDKSFTEQLRYGIRFFDLDIAYHNGELKGCHSSAYDGTTAKAFQQISDYLNDQVNLKQVIVIRISDVRDITASNSHILFDQMRSYFSGTNGKTGLNDFKSRNSRWPTLQEAVNENKRVFVIAKEFICSSSCFRSYPWIINEDENVGDTYQKRHMTSSCSGIVADTRANCQANNTKTFILESHFGSSGVCVSDMAGLCDQHLPSAVSECASVRNPAGKSVNFIAVDYANRASDSVSVVTIAKEQNVNNVRRLGL